MAYINGKSVIIVYFDTYINGSYIPLSSNYSSQIDFPLYLQIRNISDVILSCKCLYIDGLV